MTTHTGIRALVTGGASGIGAATVALLRARGADVVVLDRTEAEPDDDRYVRAELTRDAEVVTAVAAAAAALGGLDVVVNNAGVGAVGDVATATDEEWFRLWDVNVVGALRGTRAASGNTASVGAPGGGAPPPRAPCSASPTRWLPTWSPTGSGSTPLPPARPTPRGSVGCSTRPTTPPPRAPSSGRASRSGGW